MRMHLSQVMKNSLEGKKRYEAKQCSLLLCVGLVHKVEGASGLEPLNLGRVERVVELDAKLRAAVVGVHEHLHLLAGRQIAQLHQRNRVSRMNAIVVGLWGKKERKMSKNNTRTRKRCLDAPGWQR